MNDFAQTESQDDLSGEWEETKKQVWTMKRLWGKIIDLLWTITPIIDVSLFTPNRMLAIQYQNELRTTLDSILLAEEGKRTFTLRQARNIIDSQKQYIVSIRNSTDNYNNLEILKTSQDIRLQQLYYEYAEQVRQLYAIASETMTQIGRKIDQKMVDSVYKIL